MLFPDLAYAAASPPGGGAQSMLPTIIMIASMLAIFYFLLLRPQQKQKRECESLLRAIKKGDRVVTTSGLFGTVVGLSEHTVTLKVADQVKLDFERAAVARIVPSDKESSA